MVIYRERRRVPPWAWGLTALAGVAVLAGLALWLQQQAGPSREQQVTEAVQRMAAQLDVLRLSHYTPEVVQDSQVRLESEYQAALEDLARVQEEWEQVREGVAPGTAPQVEESLERLESLLRGVQPPEEVSRLIEALLADLQEAGPASP